MLLSKSRSESDSETSSVYPLEWPETYVGRALQLCRDLTFISDKEVSIKALAGGAYNIIIKITVHSRDYSGSHSHYILRIPRYKSCKLDRDVAPLQLLHQLCITWAPEVIVYDTTNQNVLQNPYMIERFLPGSELLTTYLGIPHDQRRIIARRLGQLYATMCSITSKHAGKLLPSSTEKPLMIQPFSREETDTAVPYESGEPKETTLQAMKGMIECQKTKLLFHKGGESYRISLYDSFVAITEELSKSSLFKQCHVSFCHLDLEPRNILFDPSSTPDSAIGIVDWDSAIFAPAFVACKPPMWIWAWNPEENEDERLANETPLDPKLLELKQLFENAAGLVYLRFAYGAEYRIARRIVRLCVDGMTNNQDFYDAEALLEEWSEVKRDLEQRQTGEAIGDSIPPLSVE
jgi:hypothetical protein